MYHFEKFNNANKKHFLQKILGFSSIMNLSNMIWDALYMYTEGLINPIMAEGSKYHFRIDLNTGQVRS